jgi:hypothetical protein
MSLIIPPGFLQAVYVLRLDGDTEDMVVTLGHEVDTASGANLDDAPNDLFNAFATEMFGVLFQNVYELIEVVTYGGNDGPTIVNVSTEASVTGPGAGAVLPPNCSYLVRKRTDLAGRRGRGRMYFPGPREADVDVVGNVTEATVGVWNAALADWYTALTSAVGARYYPPVVLHKSEGIGEEPPPTPITQFTMDDKIATQRRRLRP